MEKDRSQWNGWFGPNYSLFMEVSLRDKHLAEQQWERWFGLSVLRPSLTFGICELLNTDNWIVGSWKSKGRRNLPFEGFSFLWMNGFPPLGQKARRKRDVNGEWILRKIREIRRYIGGFVRGKYRFYYSTGDVVQACDSWQIYSFFVLE